MSTDNLERIERKLRGETVTPRRIQITIALDGDDWPAIAGALGTLTRGLALGERHRKTDPEIDFAMEGHRAGYHVQGTVAPRCSAAGDGDNVTCVLALDHAGPHRATRVSSSVTCWPEVSS